MRNIVDKQLVNYTLVFQAFYEQNQAKTDCQPGYCFVRPRRAELSALATVFDRFATEVQIKVGFWGDKALYYIILCDNPMSRGKVHSEKT